MIGIMKKILDDQYIKWRNYQNYGNSQKDANTLFFNILLTAQHCSNFEGVSDDEKRKIVGLLLNLFINQFIQIKPSKKAFNDIVRQQPLSELRANIYDYKSHISRSHYAFGSVCEVFWKGVRGVEYKVSPPRTLYWRWIDLCHPRLEQSIEPTMIHLAKEAEFYPGNILPIITLEDVDKTGLSHSEFKKAAAFHVTSTLLKEILQSLHELSSAPGSLTMELAQQRKKN